MTCCQSALKSDEYLFACNISSLLVDEPKNVYSNPDQPFPRLTWLAKCTLDTDTPKLVCEDIQMNSIHIGYDLVDTVLEFANNRLLVSRNPDGFLVLNDWKVEHIIKESVAGNVQKYW